MQPPHYYQVLTGVLPYDGINDYSVASRVQFGERPSRPMDRDANRWLRHGVWDMFTTCWSEDPKKRWEARAVRELFSTLGLREVRNVNSGN